MRAATATLLLLLGACANGDKSDTSGADSIPLDTAETADTVESTPPDADGDGSPADEDCDDTDASVYPGQPETCDGVDQDCDSLIDEEATDAGTWYADGDGDGYGDPSSTVLACEAGPGAVVDASDCDDTVFSTNPGAEEICEDGADNDCDGGPGDCRLTGTSSGADGVALPGEAGGDRAGSAVAGPGDLDGDGFSDLAVGAPGADGGGSGAGAVTVWFGPVLPDTSLSTVTLTGEAEGDGAGSVLAGAGDLDGDGLGELLVGAPGASEAGADAGAVYVLSLPEAGSLKDAAARLDGLGARDSAGSYLAGLGDLDGDGLAEIAVGAPEVDGVGAVYVLLGADALSATLDEAEAVLAGETSGDALGPVAAAGDLDGDGISELAVGAPGEDTAGGDAGAIYVLNWPLASDTLGDAMAIRRGEAEGDGAGGVLAGVGDTDGDGYADLLVGGPYSDAGGAYSGIAWLLRGPLAADGSLLDADARILGASDGETAGAALAGPGDVDGDGFAELLVGLPWGDYLATNGGGAALFYGPVAGTLLSEDAGALLAGDAGLARAGTAVAGAGDASGDGRPDLVVGAPYVRGVGSDSGVAWLVAGAGL